MATKISRWMKRGSAGSRVLSAYVAFVLAFALVGPGVAVFADEAPVTDPVVTEPEAPPADVAEEPKPEAEPAKEKPTDPVTEPEAPAETPEVVEEVPAAPAEEAVALDPVEPAVEEAPVVATPVVKRTVEEVATVAATEADESVAALSLVDPVPSSSDNPPLVAGGVKIDPGVSGVYTAADIPADNMKAPIPADFEITITVYEVDGEGWYFDFSSNYPISLVVAKGGSAGAYDYIYNPAVMSDTGLHAPANPNDKWAGLSHVTFYFGEIPEPETGDLTVYKFWDADEDGLYDEGELMLEDWEFTLSRGTLDEAAALEIVDSGLTDEFGKIDFWGLDPGEYTVTETLQDGWTNTTPLSQDVTVAADQMATLWFGNVPEEQEPETGDLTVYKFWDADEDGLYDEGELMLEDWAFDLTQSTPPLIEVDALAIWLVDSGLTDEFGELAFTGLDPGEYTATETLQDGWTNTTPLSQDATVVAGQTVELWFGNVPEEQEPETGDLTVYKFWDADEDGLYDEGELMLEDWEFTLSRELLARITPLEIVDSGLTDEFGELDFMGLDPGVYTVTETLQDGWINTTPLSQDATVVAGQTAELWFGNVPEEQEPETGDLIVYKFEDVNRNGLYDEGEPMLEDWEFTLSREVLEEVVPFEIVDTGLTDADGELAFIGLDPGEYTVTETMQDGWTNSTPLSQDVTIVAGETAELWFGNYEEFLPFTDLDLAITKVADRETADPEDVITYTLTYRNLGETVARDFTIVDDFDERYVTVIDAAGGTVSGGKITWAMPGPLALEDGPKTITYKVKVIADMPDGTTRIDNTVVISHPDDSDPTNNTDDERVTVTVGEPFLPFTGGEVGIMLGAAAIFGSLGALLRRKERESIS